MWARAVSEFGAIVILTYNPKVASVLSYDRFTSYGLSEALPVAAVLVLLALVPLAALRALARRRPLRAARDDLARACQRARRQVSAHRRHLRRAAAARYGVVIGPAGAGKTTLLETIAGVIRVDVGRSHARRRRRRRTLPPEARGVGIVYQHAYLFPHLTVGENVAYGAASAAGGRRRRRRGSASTRFADRSGRRR